MKFTIGQLIIKCVTKHAIRKHTPYNIQYTTCNIQSSYANFFMQQNKPKYFFID
jgi:hypothetical protein